MSRLMRTSEIVKRPVVTLGGEDLGQIKDVVYADDGEVAGFTLAGRGLFSGPLKEILRWSEVLALGADAVIIADDGSLRARDDLVAAAGGGGSANVLGARVLTDRGTELGDVVDVVLQVDHDGGASRCEVVGYEISPSDALEHHGANRLLIPLPDTVSASGEHLIVPDGATEFVMDDLAGFGAAVDAFRARLAGEA